MPKKSSDVAGGDQVQAVHQQQLRGDALRLWATEGVELTIASGAIDISAKYSGIYTIDTESEAGSDTLDTISNGEDGEIIGLVEANSSRIVTVDDGGGNIHLLGGLDRVLTGHPLLLRYDGGASAWYQVGDGRLRAFMFSLGSGQYEVLDTTVDTIPYIPDFYTLGWWMYAKESGSITVNVKHGSFGGALSTQFSPALSSAQTGNSTEKGDYSAGTWQAVVNGDATTIEQVWLIIFGVLR